jgi:dTMP kinase
MFITFEGIDGSGKSTQLELLQDTLVRKGFKILATKQPGGTEIGQLIRGILLNPDNTQIVPEAEVLLYLADRVQHIKQIISPALERGEVVLCDRYHDATVAYQGGGRKLNLAWQQDFEKKFVVKPDLTFWLDISVEESRKRLEIRNKDLDMDNCRLEREDAAFFNRIRAEYQRISQKETGRFITITAEGSIESIQSQISKIVVKLLR